jgi:hypothetical protein
VIARCADESLAELRAAVRAKLALPADAPVQMEWLHDNESMLLDDGTRTSLSCALCACSFARRRRLRGPPPFRARRAVRRRARAHAGAGRGLCGPGDAAGAGAARRARGRRGARGAPHGHHAVPRARRRAAGPEAAEEGGGALRGGRRRGPLCAGAGGRCSSELVCAGAGAASLIFARGRWPRRLERRARSLRGRPRRRRSRSRPRSSARPSLCSPLQGHRPSWQQLRKGVPWPRIQVRVVRDHVWLALMLYIQSPRTPPTPRLRYRVVCLLARRARRP